MTPRLLLMILTSVSMSALAQVLFKWGMRPTAATDVPTNAGGFAEMLLKILLNPAIVGGFALYGGSAVLWLFVLRKVDLSLAYPFVSIGFVLTVIAGWWIFNETLSTGRIVGTLLVCAGVTSLALSR